jgi:hypothetical protein
VDAQKARRSLPKAVARRVRAPSEPELAFVEALGSETRLFQD